MCAGRGGRRGCDCSGFHQPQCCCVGGLCVCLFFFFSGWKKLDIDVRASFHLEAGYPLSKHQGQLTNESHSDKGPGGGCFLGTADVLLLF